MEIIKNRKIPFTISGILFVVSVIALFLFGLKPGIDFTGGALMEVRFGNERPEISEVQLALSEMNLGEVLIQPTGEDNMILKMRFVSEEEHQAILGVLREKFQNSTEEIIDEDIISEDTVEDVVGGDTNKEEINFELPTIETEEVIDKPIIQVPDVLEERFETIGAAISSHLRERSMYAAVAVVLAIILYIGYTFRKVSKPVQSWKYGVTAIIALFHDVIITMAVFAVLGHYAGVEVGISFVVALLTIMGYSVNDTIVVFDRIRENLIKRGSDQFDETVNMGVKQSITRSLNTSLTTLFVFGGESIHYFSLTLIVGIVVGTYSSIFLASPLLVEWANYKKR